MIKVEYPDYRFRIKKDNNIEFIFDELRKSWVRLTPEEWVRQNFVQYLVQVKKYPSSLIAIEKEIQLGELKKRFDLLVYDQQLEPWMLVECKEMNVEINEKVLLQVLRYNVAVPVRYIVLTNGSYCIGYKKQDNGLELLNCLPPFG